MFYSKNFYKKRLKTAVSEVEATAATAALTAGEGAATAGAGALKLGIKAVGTAIKSIPVIGWILTAVAALTTLISLVASANKEADMGDQIAADIIEKDKERKQLLNDIVDKHQKVSEN